MSAWQFTKGLHDLGHGCYAYLQPDGGYGYSNAGLIVSGDESLLVDTLFDVPLTREMLATMRMAVPQAQSINTLINTHAHPDHTAGNILLDGTEIVTSEATHQEMLVIDSPLNPMRDLIINWERHGEAGQYLHDVMGSKFEVHAAPQRMPDRVFDRELHMKVGDKLVSIIRVGPAHSSGDTLVYLPEDRVLFTGDILFHEVHPLVMPGAAGAWIKACDQILLWDVEVIVPGHGPIADKSGVKKLRDYLVYFTHEARQRYDAGMSYKEAALDISLSTFKGWVDEERILGTLNGLYTEFGAEPRSIEEVLTAASRYRRYKLAGCGIHGAQCATIHPEVLLPLLNA